MINIKLLNYLPLIIFIAFLFPNTRISYLNQIMITNRWVVLFIITVFMIFYRLVKDQHYELMTSKVPFNKVNFIFLLSFMWLGLSIIGSVNKSISFMKWGTFLTFIIFCLVYSQLMIRKEQIIETLKPIMYIFLIIIWTTPIAIKYFPQKLLDSLGALNGVFVFAPQLGHLLATFGTTTTLFLLNEDLTKLKKGIYIITLIMSIYFTIASKSRASTVITLVLLAIALYRGRSDKIKNVKIMLGCLLVLLLFMNLGLKKSISQFMYKSDDGTGTKDLMESRTPFFQKTLEAYERRQLFGYGFGVTEGMDNVKLMYESAGGREQGSTIYGLLEEVGFVG